MAGDPPKLKILAISELTSLKKRMKGNGGTLGGIETNHRNLVAGFKQRGHIVVETLPPPEKFHPDIIICPTFGPASLWNIFTLKRKYACACVQHGHTTLEDLRGGFLPDWADFVFPFLRIYLRNLYRFSEILITPSNFSKQSLLRLGIPTHPPIVPVSNGVNLEKFQFSPQKRGEFKAYLKEKFNIDLARPVILGVGVIWERKGIDVFHAMAVAFPGCQFVWVGNYITAKKVMDKYNNLPNLTFTGFVDDVVAAYCGADVFFFPSRAENQGIPLLEAAACRLPILCRALPTYDWIENDVHCLKETTFSGFKAALQRLLDDPDLRERLAANALDNVQAHDLEKVIDIVESVYRRAIRLRKRVFAVKASRNDRH
jgi:glycosyltransferase involved in cell wall biosynthesis